MRLLFHKGPVLSISGAWTRPEETAMTETDAPDWSPVLPPAIEDIERALSEQSEEPVEPAP